MSSKSVFDAVWSWSENNDCPVTLWRDEDGDWRVTVETRDGRTWRRATGVLPSDQGRGETPDDFAERVRLQMKKIVKAAYAARRPLAA